MARQHARNKQRETALESYSQQMARRAGTQPATVTMSPVPALLSQKATAPYRAPQPSAEVRHVPGPETQQMMEEMEEDDMEGEKAKNPSKEDNVISLDQIMDEMEED